MKITITDNYLIYIYFHELEESINVGTAEAKSRMLFDSYFNWVGIEITNLNIGYEDKVLTIPPINNTNTINHNSYIKRTNNKLLIYFDYHATVKYKDIPSQFTLIDFANGKIVGIEISLSCYNEYIGNRKKYVKPYIIYDNLLKYE